MKFKLIALAIASTLTVGVAQADIVLGAYNFNSQQFGNTLLESDGGTFSAIRWLNVVNVNPGNPGYLTGANFNTGIANIGIGGSPSYTIGYGTPIANGVGNDLGVVTARFSSDTIRLAVSTDGGGSFSAPISFAPGLAGATGVGCNYFFAGIGPFSCNLFVTPVDLGAFGIASGASINAIRVTGSPELDLIRIAGFGDPSNRVPEPTSLALMGVALGVLALRRRRQS